MAKSKKQIVTPELNLKVDDFMHAVNEDQQLEIIVHFKREGGKVFEPEVINPVMVFAKQGGQLKIINRNAPDLCYAFDLKQVSKAFIVPMA